MPAQYRSINIYRHTFSAKCPSDGEMIVYSLEIRSPKMILVEHIKTATALIKEGFQEQIADALIDRFCCEVEVKAVHQGVSIESLRLIE